MRRPRVLMATLVEMRKGFRAGWILACLASVILIVTAIHLWRIDGVVVDHNGAPMKGVKVLITLRSEGLRAPIPHAWTASSSCLGSAVRETDAKGRFSLVQITWGMMLPSKSFTVQAFSPGWYQSSNSRRVDSLFVSSDDGLRLQLQLDKGERWSFAHGNVETTPLTLDTSSPLYERTMSRGLTSAADLGSHLSGCSGTGEIVVGETLSYAIQNARTKDELNYIRNRCVDAANRVSVAGMESGRKDINAMVDMPKACRGLF